MHRSLSTITTNTAPKIRHSTMTYAHNHPLMVARAGAAAHTQGQPMHPFPSSSGSKTIYLIRHGEGFHNIGYDHNLDAHLTPRGWAQTAALQQHLQALQPQLGIQLVVVSPLRRTLETAAGVFGAKAPPATAEAAATAATAAAAAGSLQKPSWVLMNQQAGRPTEITSQQMLYVPPVQRHAVIAAAGAAAAGTALDAAMHMGGDGSDTAGIELGAEQQHEPLRLLAHEGCRERIGPNVCDKFRDIKLQAAGFPGVDFSLLQHSTDEAWQALHDAQCHDGGCYLTGEEESHCEGRALEFYAWLLDRPESVIAVVSHCGFLVHGMRALGKSMYKTWGDAMMSQINPHSIAPSAATASTNPAPTYPSINSSAAVGSTNAGSIPVQSAFPAAQGIPFPPPGLSTAQHPFGSHPSPHPSSHLEGVAAQPVGAASAQYGSTGSATPQAPTVSGLNPKITEALRQSATDLTGWMSADWMNCECRSIQLTWGDTAQLLSDPSGATASSNGDGEVRGSAAVGALGGKFLWARPGEGSTWFPGGMYGIAPQPPF